jgi:hypothetical protein
MLEKIDLMFVSLCICLVKLKNLPPMAKSGTNVRILKIFSPKKMRKNCELTQNKAKLCKSSIITLFFENNANFFAENRQKLQKIVIMTSALLVALFPTRLSR